ncbi:unnamed protein product [Schistocephalus solidus]|uniref:thioredoxin-dependent peroxiredoxin n=1 Tax=Schistocephalus solidus TaxID=70667 RepID=A0A183TRC4_SCHSO|nr:unnamed protein product [Schistocephalus solidus]
MPSNNKISSLISGCRYRKKNTPRKAGGLGGLSYPLLSDYKKQIAKEEPWVALRGLFIIDPKGTVRQITINDLPVGRSVDEILRLVKAFHFTDKHGDGKCPPTFTPSPQAAAN